MSETVSEQSRFSLPKRWFASIRLRSALIALGVVLVLMTLVAWYWSREPGVFWVDIETESGPAVTGHATTDTLLRVIETLLEKPGGYLSNDVTPPSVFLDNIPSWEYGALVQARDLARVLRNDYSRSQSQSTEDTDLGIAEPALNFDRNSWLLPPSELEYKKSIEALERYKIRLGDPGQPDAQFYARADNLREWLAVVEKRLGSLSQRLAASVGQVRVNTDLAGDPAAKTATPRPDDIRVKTPWLLIDNVFFEARARG